MRKQFAVIGLGRFGSSVAQTLSELGHDVLAVDTNEGAVQSMMNYVTHAVQADAQDEDTLRALGIRNFEVAIVAIGDDVQANILITLMLKEMGVKKVIAKAINLQHGKVLEKIGADKVIYPEKDMGIRLAHQLVSYNVMDFMELAEGYKVIEAKTPLKFVGKTLSALNLRAKYGISVIAIKKADRILVAPGADELIEEDDVLVIVGDNEALKRMQD